MRRVIVLGDGTGVGKTHFTVCAARSLARIGPVLALKPIETGIPHGTGNAPRPDSDAGALEAACPTAHFPRPHPRYAFEPPISPHLAAERAGTTIELDAIRIWVENAEANLQQPSSPSTPVCLVETAGGSHSPISIFLKNIDLAQALAPARWVLVAANTLGVLHRVTATVEALKARGRGPDWIVLSDTDPADRTADDNVVELRRLDLAPVFRLISQSNELSPELLTALIE